VLGPRQTSSFLLGLFPVVMLKKISLRVFSFLVFAFAVCSFPTRKSVLNILDLKYGSGFYTVIFVVRKKLVQSILRIILYTCLHCKRHLPGCGFRRSDRLGDLRTSFWLSASPPASSEPPEEVSYPSSESG
jgi:hypothetical protein